MAIHEIVKYNPINYLNGVYITEEWSSKSDIGKIFNGHKFTINEYMQTEREYIDAVKIIMFFHKKGIFSRLFVFPIICSMININAG